MTEKERRNAWRALSFVEKMEWYVNHELNRTGGRVLRDTFDVIKKDGISCIDHHVVIVCGWSTFDKHFTHYTIDEPWHQAPFIAVTQ